MSKQIHIPGISVSNPECDYEIDEYDDKDDIYFKQNTLNEIITTKFKCKIEYPLTTPVVFKLEKEGGLTLKEILEGISREYKRIYKEEDESTQLKVETVNKRSGGTSKLINRAKTNGKYGIWGHVIGDLVFELLAYECHDDEGYDNYDLCIGS